MPTLKKIKHNRSNVSDAKRTRRRVVTKKQKEKIKTKHRVKSLLTIITLLGLLALTAYFLLSTKYQIKALAVESSDEELSAAVTKSLINELSQDSLFIPNKNQFLWTKARVANVVAEFSSVSSFDYSISDNEINLEIVTHKPIAKWCDQIDENKSCFGINQAGEIFSSSNLDSYKDLVAFSDTKLVAAEPGDFILEPKILVLLSQDLLENLVKFGYHIDSIELDEQKALVKVNSTSDADHNIQSIILPSSDIADTNRSIKDLLFVLDQEALTAIAQENNVSYFSVLDLTNQDKLFYRFVSNDEISETNE